MDWMFMPYRRYADFEGRSCRREYWTFTLFTFIFLLGVATLLVAGGIGSNDGGGPLLWIGIVILVIWSFGSIIPSIAVQVRRFHDQDKTGWLVLLGLVPYIGSVIVLVFMCLPGTRGANRYGADPLGSTGSN